MPQELMPQQLISQRHYQLRTIKLAWGLVKHHRDKPKRNSFSTGACFIQLVFGKATENSLPKYPVVDAFGLVSVSARSYGFKPHQLKFPEFVAQLTETIEQESGECLPGEVHLYTFPKMLGCLFNPVSFWYFHNADHQCRAILCEVNNTFGERHFYLLNANESAAPLDKGGLLQANKTFHVSPFFPVSGRYAFRFFRTAESTVARINYFEGDEQQLSTSISGKLMEPNTLVWINTVLKYGWFTFIVIAKIHWQALKLLFKGAKYYRKPEPPHQTITHTKFKA